MTEEVVRFSRTLMVRRFDMEIVVLVVSIVPWFLIVICVPWFLVSVPWFLVVAVVPCVWLGPVGPLCVGWVFELVCVVVGFMGECADQFY